MTRTIIKTQKKTPLPTYPSRKIGLLTYNKVLIIRPSKEVLFVGWVVCWGVGGGGGGGKGVPNHSWASRSPSCPSALGTRVIPAFESHKIGSQLKNMK